MRRKFFYTFLLFSLHFVFGFTQFQWSGSNKQCEDPYAICHKKMPTGNNFLKIVPSSVCKWKRIFYKTPTPQFDGEAWYSNGSDSIFMLFSLQKDFASRKSVFQTIEKEAVEDDNLISKQEPPADPAWLKIGRGDHVFFAWTRSNYIFSCECKEGWKTLDEFMKCFPS